jgi:hypothetical protein
MSRQLPPRPNLEHLKNQAKEKLERLQTLNPDAKLADALHAVAREYGFATWPQLKAHVVALSVETRSPFAGNWIGETALLQFDVDGQEVTITDVSPDGKEQRSKNTLQADGLEHASDYGYGIKATWLSPNVLETVVTKDREVVGMVRYEVSTDSRTLTLEAESRNHNQYPATSQRAVLVRE